MADLHHSARMDTYAPELISSVDGFAVDALIVKVGDKNAQTYVVVGFDLAWNSRNYHPVVVVRKVGGTRRTKIHARELEKWTAA
jgi:hypothetical protein